jgi:hypothetical protein
MTTLLSQSEEEEEGTGSSWARPRQILPAEYILSSKCPAHSLENLQVRNEEITPSISTGSVPCIQSIMDKKIFGKTLHLY